VVNRDGIVCAIVFSGTTRADQWPAAASLQGTAGKTTLLTSQAPNELPAFNKEARL
jgi:hypothetical protein